MTSLERRLVEVCFACIFAVLAAGVDAFSYTDISESSLPKITASLSPDRWVSGVVAPGESKKYSYHKADIDDALLFVLESKSGDADLYAKIDKEASAIDYDYKSDLFQVDHLVIPSGATGQVFLVVFGSVNCFVNSTYTLMFYSLPGMEDDYTRIVKKLGHADISSDESSTSRQEYSHGSQQSEKKKSSKNKKRSQNVRDETVFDALAVIFKILLDIIQAILEGLV